MLDPQRELDRFEAQLQSTGDVIAFLNELSRLARVRRLEMDDGGLESTFASDGKDLPPIPTPAAPQPAAESPEYTDVQAADVGASLPQFVNDPPPAGVAFSYDVPPIPVPDPALPQQSTGDFTGSAALPVIADDGEGGLPHPPSPIGQGESGALPAPPPPAQNSTVEASLPSDLGPLPAPPAIELPEQINSPTVASGVDEGVQAGAVNSVPPIPTPPTSAGYRDEEFGNYDDGFRMPETLPVPDLVVVGDQETEITNQLADDEYRWRSMMMDVIGKQQEELGIQMARMYRLHALQHQQRSYYT